MREQAGYSGTPLPRKLGIKAGMTVGLFGAPPGFAATLGTLPDGARLVSGARGPRGLVIWFVRREKELKLGIRRMSAFAGGCPLWIAWPRKAGRSPAAASSSLDENDVREAGLDSGLVDYKVCAIDATWSGLLFARRRTAE